MMRSKMHSWFTRAIIPVLLVVGLGCNESPSNQGSEADLADTDGSWQLAGHRIITEPEFTLGELLARPPEFETRLTLAGGSGVVRVRSELAALGVSCTTEHDIVIGMNHGKLQVIEGNHRMVEASPGNEASCGAARRGIFTHDGEPADLLEVRTMDGHLVIVAPVGQPGDGRFVAAFASESDAVVADAGLAAADAGVDAVVDAGIPPDRESPDSGTVPDAVPTRVGKRVFVTSRSFPADLVTAGMASEAHAAADALCRSMAATERLEGDWRAWISTSTLDAIDHIQGEGPWLDMAGTVLFRDRNDLQTGALSAVNRDEAGDRFRSEYYAHTGTGRNGRLATTLVSEGHTTANCADWTVASSAGGAHYVAGRTEAYGSREGGEWTNAVYVSCFYTSHLYCFEQ